MLFYLLRIKICRVVGPKQKMTARTWLSKALDDDVADLILHHLAANLAATRLQSSWRGYRLRAIGVRCPYYDFEGDYDDVIESVMLLKEISHSVNTGWRDGQPYTIEDAANERIIKWLWRYDQKHLRDLLQRARSNLFEHLWVVLDN